MIDRTTKFLLAAIAAGLWLNLAAPLLRISVAHATSQDTIYLGQIEAELVKIGSGTCTNSRLC